MIYGYVRVSTNGQFRKGYSVEDQTENILSRYPDAKIIIEPKSGRKERSKFNELLEQSLPGDTIVVTKMDRFCRTAKEGLEYADLLFDKKVNFHILNMGLIDNTPVGKMVLTNLLAYSEFELYMILERTSDGKARAKLNPDFKEGRPKKYSKKKIEHALQLKNIQGNSYRQVEELTGISVSTLKRANKTFELKNIENKIPGSSMRSQEDVI
jgi:DNA invertase Pin-like site-specific DNA recombinase